MSIHLLICKQLLGQDESQSEKVFFRREEFPYLTSFLLLLRVLRTRMPSHNPSMSKVRWRSFIFIYCCSFFLLDQFFSTLEPNHCIFHYRKCTLKEDLFSMLMLIFLRIIFICLGRDFVAFIVILCQTQSSLNSTLSIIPTPESPQGNNVLQEQQQTLSPKYHFISMSYTQ